MKSSVIEKKNVISSDYAMHCVGLEAKDEISSFAERAAEDLERRLEGKL